MHRFTSRLFSIFMAVAVLASSAHAAWQAGLKSGYITDPEPIDTTTENPGNDGSRLNIHAGETTAAPPWGDDRCWIYTGQIFLTNGATYHFAENIDDEVWLKIGGTVYLNDGTWNSPTKSGAVTGNGWVDFELRLDNGGGGAGPVGGNNWTGTKGFGYNVNGNDTTSGSDYNLMADNGSMNLFRFDDGSANPTNSSRRLQIAISGYDKGDTLTNFPLLVVLGSNVSGFAYSQFAFTDGRDLYFTDSASNTVLKYEVEKWNTNGASYIWVQIPTLKANTNILAFWGDSSISTAPAYTTNGTVWDASYRAVWHMQLSNSNLLDSSSNHLNGVTMTKTAFPPTNAVGVAGNAVSFESCHTGPQTNWIVIRGSDGGDNSVDLGVTGDHAYMAEQWVYCTDTNGDSAAGGNGPYWCYGSGGNYRQIGLGITATSGTNGRWGILHWNDPAYARDTYLQNMNWQHVVFTYDPTDAGGREKFYVNGQLKQTVDPGVDYDFHPSAPLFFHASPFSWWAADGQYGPSNIMDEVRFSNIDRGSNYQWATWMNTASNSSFETYGSATALQSSGPSINNGSGASSVSTNTATLNGNLTSTGTAATFVWVYWGTSDGGSTKGAWANSGYMGQKNTGALTTNITGLTGNRTYHYRFYASNSVSDAWASDSSFTTLADPGLYPYRMQLSFPGYSQASSLSNFPALVVLNTTRTVTTSNSTTIPFSYGQFLSGQGNDLRFSDQSGSSNLMYEIESWSTSGSSYVWVTIPLLASNTTIWAYWGDASQSTQPAYTTNGTVWDASYRAVWHMQLTGSNLLDSAQHSLGRLNGVTQTKNSYPPTNAVGQIGTAVSFESCHRGPYTNWIAVRSASGLDTNVDLGVGGDHAYTLEQWIYAADTNCDNAAGGNGGYWSYGSGGANRQIALTLARNDTNDPTIISNGYWGVSHWNDPVLRRDTKAIYTNWQHVVITYNPTDSTGTERLYVNGQLKESWDPGTDYDFHRSAQLYFHASTFSWWAADGQYGPTNIMDEVRFSTIDRGSNYQWATWLNTASNSAFVNYGVTVGSLPAISNSAATSVLATSATLNGSLTSSGSIPTQVWLFWEAAASDQGTNQSAWANSAYMGYRTVGAITTNVTGLSSNSQYYYTYMASNSVGIGWATPSLTFTTKAMPTVTNSAATAVAATTATANGNVTATGGSPSEVWLYWGTADGGSTKASWGNSGYLGFKPTGAVLSNMTALASNTTYFYRFYASNSFGDCWATPSTSFTTKSMATITNSAATGIGTTNATLNGNVTFTGASPTAVWVYWGASDAGNTKTSWVNTGYMGFNPQGAIATNVTTLSSNTTYYYRFYASNTYGDSWSTSSTTFVTLGMPLVTNNAASAVASASATANGTVTLTGGAPSTVWLYWGTADGGSTKASWGNVGTLGFKAIGPVSSNLTGLISNTLYYYRFYASNAYGDCWATASTNFTTLLPQGSPLVTNNAATAISAGTATANATVTFTGGAPTEVWLYWGAADGGSTKGSWGNVGTLGFKPTGAVSSNLTALTSNTTYYYRFYASNTYGECWATPSTNFTTWSMPIVTNNSATAVAAITATANGNVASTGGAPTEVWLYWGTSDGVSTKASWGNTGYLGFKPTGTVLSNLTALASNTTYFYRFYASNGAGDAWATASSNFTTKSMPTVTNNAATSVAASTATANGNVTFTGGTPSEVWMFWGTADGGSTKASWGNSGYLGFKPTGAVLSNMTALASNTTYFYRFYASNTYGDCWATASTNFTTLSGPLVTNNAATAIAAMTATANGNVTLTGGAPTTVWMYWGTTDGGSTKASWGNVGSLGFKPTGAVTSNLTALASNTTYFYRFYASNTYGDCWATASTNFTTLGMPLVTNNAATSVAASTATANGTVTFTGGAPTTVWIYWGTTDGGSVKTSWTSVGSLGFKPTGVVASNLTALASNTTYYYRFYASNAYGDCWATASTNFTTQLPQSNPLVTNNPATSVGASTATANGAVLSTGGAATTVWMYWGNSDGGSAKTSWSNVGSLGIKTAGAVSSNMTGLSLGSTYYYRFYASNAVGEGWSASESFATLSATSLYPYKLQLSFPGYRQTSGLTNFPALVVLNTSRMVTYSNNTTLPFSYGQFLSGVGNDLRFADLSGATNLPYEIEKWNTSGSSYIWVTIPLLTSNTTIWAYWGDASQSSQPAYTTNGAVWDASYRAVWHMQLTSSNLLDSSSNQQNGVTMTKTSFPPTNATGMAGDAVSFDSCHSGPQTNWIVIRGSDSGDNTVNLGVTGDHAYMAEQWVYCTDTNGDSAAGGNGPFWCYGSGGNNRQIGLSITASSITNGKWAIQHWNDPVYARETYLQHMSWQHVVFTYDPTDSGGREKFYVNGELKQTVDPGTDYDFHPSAPLFFHASPFSWWAADGQYGPSNIMDEVRFSNIDRGSNYQWATWMNTASNASFINYGAPAASAPSVSNTPATSVLNTTATANGMLLSSGGATTLLWIYYGIADGSVDKTDWSSSMALGTATVGAVTASLTGLSPLTGYAYRFYASNSVGDAWSPVATGFTTYGLPSLTNQAASSIATDGATLSANIQATGNAPAYVWLYWGTSDGSTNKAAWGHVTPVGSRPIGVVAVDMAGAMAENTLYFYNFYASNFIGAAWGGSPSSPSFTTLLSPTTDTDSDGMPDWWEIRYFGGATNASSSANSDGDPLSNEEEYLAGTSPTNSTSYLRIIGFTSQGGTNQVVWFGGTNGAGTPYRILTRTNLSLGTWSESATQSRQEGSNVWTSTDSDRVRFYSISATN